MSWVIVLVLLACVQTIECADLRESAAMIGTGLRPASQKIACDNVMKNGSLLEPFGASSPLHYLPEDPRKFNDVYTCRSNTYFCLFTQERTL